MIKEISLSVNWKNMYNVVNYRNWKYLLMNFIFSISFLIVTNSFGQINNLNTEFNLPNVLEESSGVIYFNDKIISHNDSGDYPNLYEVDVNTGQVTRIIQVTNANNEDWEDITQDANYIYIGDFGNNDGDRTDLKVYRISKSDVIASNYVTAQIINFSYEDQTDFSENEDTNFDAESVVIYNNQILVFTRNRGDHRTKAYVFPKTIGTHTATKIGTYNVNGSLTGATFNSADNSFFLTGYNHDSGLHPFLIYLGDFTGNAIFNGTIVKTDITSLIGLDSQIEGITNLGNEQYYMSCEERNGVSQRLFSFESMYLLDIEENLFKPKIIIFPNPLKEKINIKSDSEITKIQIFSVNGKLLVTKTNQFLSMDVSSISKGTYFIKIFTERGVVIKKLLIN